MLEIVDDDVEHQLRDIQKRTGKSIEEIISMLLRYANSAMIDSACMPKVGEPYFVLLARDVLSVNTVLFWVREAIKAGAPVEKVAGACLIAREMKWWQNDHREQVKVPD